MAKRPGEIGLTRAADLLGVHADTLRRWCSASAAGEAPRRAPPREALRQDYSGRWWVRRSWIDRALEGDAT